MPHCNWMNHVRAFDIAGNVVSQSDGNYNTTTLGYTGWQNEYAFPTSTRNALGQTTAAWYDYGAGRVTQISDLNGENTTYAYTDALDRPTQVRRAAGGGAGLESQTNYSYPSPNQGNSFEDLNSTGDEALRNEVDYDGLGRARASLQYGDAAGAIETDTTYDALGRVHSISNPYRPSETVYTTTTSYDALSRVTQVMTADGAATTTSYSGNQTTVMDPAGKKENADI